MLDTASPVVPTANTDARSNQAVARRRRKKTKSRRPRSMRAKALLVTLSICYGLLVGEIGARAYWALSKGIPFFQPQAVWNQFYPEVRESNVETTAITQTDHIYDVLLLGGSVLHENFGTIAETLEQRLSSKLRWPVRIFNLAQAAHTTRDSYLKYRRLGDKQFDLVVVYHGINDARMNNCPTDMFRDDYTHCSWYAAIEQVAKHKELSALALPYALDHLRIRIADEMGFYVPRHNPNEKWTNHGARIKTAGPFRSNLQQILAAAASKGEPVIVMTFAHYVAPGYSDQAFREHELDYGPRGTPIELWGKPEHVVPAIEVHNRVLTDLSREFRNAIFVDQQALMPKNGQHFNDICHFTNTGCERFVDNIINALPKQPAVASNDQRVRSHSFGLVSCFSTRNATTSHSRVRTPAGVCSAKSAIICRVAASTACSHFSGPNWPAYGSRR